MDLWKNGTRNGVSYGFFSFLFIRLSLSMENFLLSKYVKPFGIKNDDDDKYFADDLCDSNQRITQHQL